MKLGYARVPTTDQNLSIQRDRLYAAGCEKLFEEKTSGARKKRPALKHLRADDGRCRHLHGPPRALHVRAAAHRGDYRGKTRRTAVHCRALGRYDDATQARGVPFGRPPKLLPEQRTLVRHLIERRKLR